LVVPGGNDPRKLMTKPQSNTGSSFLCVMDCDNIANFGLTVESIADWFETEVT
jgi:hypothetical protein